MPCPKANQITTMAIPMTVNNEIAAAFMRQTVLSHRRCA